MWLIIVALPLLFWGLGAWYSFLGSQQVCKKQQTISTSKNIALMYLASWPVVIYWFSLQSTMTSTGNYHLQKAGGSIVKVKVNLVLFYHKRRKIYHLLLNLAELAGHESPSSSAVRASDRCGEGFCARFPLGTGQIFSLSHDCDVLSITSFSLSLNYPLSPNSDKHLISPYKYQYLINQLGHKNKGNEYPT